MGASGITGAAIVSHLLASGGWRVLTLSRRSVVMDPRVEHVSADLRDLSALAEALRGAAPTHVFFTAWSRQGTEAENIRVNGGMVRDLLAALRDEPVADVESIDRRRNREDERHAKDGTSGFGVQQLTAPRR